jgi:hypothetical protein
MSGMSAIGPLTVISMEGHAKTPTESVLRGTWRVAILVLVVLLCGLAWLVATGELYEAGSDFGYNLGLVGGLLMVSLLVYPLRKRIRVAGGRVGVGENGAPFVDSTLSGAGVNVAVADGQRLRLTLATRAQDGSLVDAAPVSEAVPLGLAQQSWMNAELVGKINNLAAQMAIVRAALTGLGVVLPPWTWTPATPPGPDLLSDAVDLSSKARG